MLTKLIKYDFKDSYKIVLLLVALIEVASILGVLFFLLPLWDDVFQMGDSVNWQFFALLIMGACVFALLIFATTIGEYGVLIMNGYSFYKSVYSNQGYLTNTLPVKSSSILFSKSLIGGLNSVIITLVSTANALIIVTVAIVVMVGKGVGCENALETFAYLGKTLCEDLGVANVALLVLIILLYVVITFATAVVNGFFKVFVLYGSLSIGQLSRKLKLFLGVVIYVVILTAQWTVTSTVASTLSMLGSIINPAIGQFVAVLVTGVVAVIVGAGMLFVTKYVMENKLNLE